MGARQALHLGEQKAKMLRMDALFAFGDVTADRRALQGGLAQRRIDNGIPVSTQRRDIDADAGGNGGNLGRTVRPEFLRVGKQVVE
jgi:hypothetical protein